MYEESNPGTSAFFGEIFAGVKVFCKGVDILSKIEYNNNGEHR